MYDPNDEILLPCGRSFSRTIFAVLESANIRVTMWNMFTRFHGKYRIRIFGYGYQSDGKPVDFHVNAGTFKEFRAGKLPPCSSSL
ncbi:MAG: hypothetical protein ACI9R3_002383 [Verrucomicrobiales bacterium]